MKPKITTRHSDIFKYWKDKMITSSGDIEKRYEASTVKKILTAILLTATIFTMSGCSPSIVSDMENESTTQTMFERHTLDGEYSILVDKDTGVCYLEYHMAAGHRGYHGLTVLLNADGTPKIWEK